MYESYQTYRLILLELYKLRDKEKKPENTAEDWTSTNHHMQFHLYNFVHWTLSLADHKNYQSGLSSINRTDESLSTMDASSINRTDESLSTMDAY